jgi:hypothetical protein
MKIIYAGFFLDDGSHVTWEFKPGAAKLPHPLKEGDKVFIHVVGKYHDKDLDADIVRVEIPGGRTLTHQGSGTVLHITRETRNGVAPVESGLRATQKGWVQVNQNSRLLATAGYFKA